MPLYRRGRERIKGWSSLGGGTGVDDIYNMSDIRRKLSNLILPYCREEYKARQKCPGEQDYVPANNESSRHLGRIAERVLRHRF